MYTSCLLKRIVVLAVPCVVLAGCAAASSLRVAPPMPTTPAAPAPEATTVMQPSEARNWAHAFLIDLRPGQDSAQIRGAAEALFDGIVSIEALFPDVRADDDAFGLGRIYRLRTGSARPSDSDWDLAYALRERGDFANVEPDSDSALADANARMATTACLGNDGVPAPVDPSWSLREMKVDKAWALTPPPGGAAFGENVRICHPDTGWTSHAEFDHSRIDTVRSLNLMEGGIDARDPLGYAGHPGHGTGTGSVLFSGGGIGATAGTLPPGVVTGLAPRATLVPIRAMNNVVQVLDSDIARAVRHAVDAQCDVISMSLGGRLFFGLERAINDAVSRDVVVVAAAGNCVGFVVAPAAYDQAIAVAGTNARHKPWIGSSKGRAVDISAPGEDVYVARAKAGDLPASEVSPGDGTSFATTAVAGAAANWIGFHGRDAIKRAQGSLTRRDLFLQVLRDTAWRPLYPPSEPAWDAQRFGAGIVDLDALLRAPLGTPRTQLRGPADDDPIALLSRMFDLEPDQVRSGVSRMLGSPDSLDGELQRVGSELLELAVRDPATFRTALRPPATSALAASDAAVTLRSGASRALASRLRGAQ